MQVPKLPEGGYILSFIEHRKRCEQAPDFTVCQSPPQAVLSTQRQRLTAHKAHFRMTSEGGTRFRQGSTLFAQISSHLTKRGRVVILPGFTPAKVLAEIGRVKIEQSCRKTRASSLTKWTKEWYCIRAKIGKIPGQVWEI
jgi:hypothetical protein